MIILSSKIILEMKMPCSLLNCFIFLGHVIYMQTKKLMNITSGHNNAFGE